MSIIKECILYRFDFGSVTKLFEHFSKSLFRLENRKEYSLYDCDKVQVVFVDRVEDYRLKQRECPDVCICDEHGYVEVVGKY